MPNWKKVIVSGSDASLSTLTITNSGSTDDSLLLTATEDSSTAAPVVTFKRNTGTAADADYLGQLKFKGENDADQEVTYAKITAKILDASDGTEDGLIEFANKKAGSNVITARLRSDSFQLLNDTNLSVDGQISASSLISNNFSGSFQGDGSSLTGINTTVVSSSTVSDTFTSATTHSVSHTLGTKDLIINVYDSNDDIFVPTRINTPTTSSVILHMDPATSGRVVIGKSGHIVSGSSLLDGTGVLSGSAQIATNISGSFTSVSASIATDIIAAHTGSFTGSFVGTGASLTNVTSSKSINTRDNSTISFWQGSQAQYDALGSYDSNVIYFTT